MQTVRRLYVYLLSGISLGVLAYGLIILLDVIFGQLGIGQGTLIGRDGENWARQQLSLAAALIGVGLPVWGIHWWFAERGLHPDRPNAEDERASVVRALYLTAVLIVLLGFGTFAARDLVREAVFGFLPRPSADFYYGNSNPAMSLASLLVAAAAWGYHVAIRRRDMARGPLHGAAAWLPRVYVYGATLVALSVTLQAFGDLARYAGETVWQPASNPDDSYRSYALADSLSTFVVWAGAWLGHWWYIGTLTNAGGWRATSERGARLRLAFFVAVILSGTVSVVRLAGEALRAVLVPVFGAIDAIGGNLGATDLLRTVAVALVSAVPWVAAWWLHQRRMREEALEADDPARTMVAMRLSLHAVALVGLAFAAVASGWLAGLLIDVLLGGSRAVGGSDFWRAELATFVPYAVLGLLVWIWRWWPIQSLHATDPAADASSTIRRSFLLIILGASVIVALGSLAFVLYRLFGLLLAAGLGGNTISELSTPIGALLAAGTVALYHGLALRRDLSLRAEAAGSIAIAEAGVAAPAAAESFALVLHGPPEGDLAAAVDALRAALPPGFTLDEG